MSLLGAELYKQQEVESLPWFNPELDDDLEKALDELGLRSGSALDLGTGPGTQAIHLARRGFAVTATDISEAAIHLASELPLGPKSPTIDSPRPHPGYPKRQSEYGVLSPGTRHSDPYSESRLAYGAGANAG
jgi:SAM-dependent methyltransferase